MHEFGMAHSIVEYALSEAEGKNAMRVAEIQVDVGELTMIDRRVLSHALRLLLTGPKLEGCRVVVRRKGVKFVCRKCAALWSMKEATRQLQEAPEELLVREPDSKEVPLHFLPSLYPVFVHCPKCGSADLEVKEGEDVNIRRMVLE
jgi:hydrogenase nickel incorporation protein HypA/HybF